MTPTTVAVATLFAEHLQRPGRRSAVLLADALDEIGDSLRARLLRGFASQGEHTVDATWWSPGSSCQASLTLPTPRQLGQLWFDPLEVSLALLTPWTGKSEKPVRFHVPGDFLDWVSLTPVTPWQLGGAHLVERVIPADPEQLAAEEAVAYCVLFSKAPTDISGWLQLRDAYGDDVFRRVWGDGGDEYGGHSGTSGFLELNKFGDLLHGTREQLMRPDTVDEMEPYGYAFRTSASIQRGLYNRKTTLPRTWTD